MWIYVRMSYQRESSLSYVFALQNIYAHHTINQSGKGIVVEIYLGL
jgi:hypothetical protein